MCFVLCFNLTRITTVPYTFLGQMVVKKKSITSKDSSLHNEIGEGKRNYLSRNSNEG